MTSINYNHTPIIIPRQFAQALSAMYRQLFTLMPQGSGYGGLNMGPSMDYMVPNYDPFSGSLPTQYPPGERPVRNNYVPVTPTAYTSQPTASSLATPTAGNPYATPTGSVCITPSSTALGTPTATGVATPTATATATGGSYTPTATGTATPTASAGGTPTAGGASPTTGGATPTATAGGDATPTASGSTGSSYVDGMMSALKSCGATQDLLDAYMHQYQLLGLVPGGGATPTGAGGATPTATGGGNPTTGSPPTPTCGGGATPTGGVTPTATATGGPPPTATAGGGTTPTGAGGGPITGGPGDAPDTPATPGSPGKVTPGNQHAYDGMIAAAANKYGVDPLLIKAIMRQESDFDPGATSESGCEGLIQVSPGTQPDTGVSGNLYQPSVCIDAGTAYIKKMLDACHGDVHKALLCYNAGPGAATDGAVPPGQDSTAGEYATTVEGWYNDLKTKGEVNTTLGSKPGS